MKEREKKHVQDHIPFASEAYLEDTLHMPSWLIMTLASVIIFGVVFSVLDHARKKPMSPQELVAAALTRPIATPTMDWKPGMGPQPLIYHPAAANQQLAVQKWQPGMGPKPFIYHPAAFQPVQANPGWNPLYICPVHGAVSAIPGQNGLPYCSICNQPLVMNK